VAMGKKVIAIDLNPLSRTARKATVSIVDNILRTVPNMAAQVRRLSKLPRADLEKMVREYDNEKVLRQSVQEIQDHLERQFPT
jgi:4-phosphopantoate---beta-alanine ligase